MTDTGDLIEVSAGRTRRHLHPRPRPIHLAHAPPLADEGGHVVMAGEADRRITLQKAGVFRGSMQHEARMEVSWCDDVARA